MSSSIVRRCHATVALGFLIVLAATSRVSAQASLAPGSELAAIEAAKRLERDEMLIRELGGMGAMDLALRNSFLKLRKDASPEQRQALDAIWRDYYEPFDRKNAARLEELLEGRTWFTEDEVGPRAADGAYSVVSHSKDLGFQKRVLAKMEALLAAGRPPPNYANLFDRVALQEGRLQRYGTQKAACKAGRHVLANNVEEPADLDERRRKAGLEPIAKYLAFLDEAYGRCDDGE